MKKENKGSVPVRIAAVGDIMLGRGVDSCSLQNLDNLLSPSVVAALQADIVTGNLECVLGQEGQPNSHSHSHFRGDILRARVLLQRFDVLSLANNHINDFGSEGITATMAALDALSVRYVGVGCSEVEAYAPVVLEQEGIQVAIFGATTVSPLKSNGAFIAAEPGPMLFKMLSNWKAKGAFCVLHLHTGGGDYPYPAPFVTDLMAEVSKTRVDLVLGHHPHMVQGRQTIGGTTIFYSLGDFVFDKLENGRNATLIVQAEFVSKQKGLAEVHSIPVIRNPSLQLNLIEGPSLKAFEANLVELDAMIADGRSTAAFHSAFGNPIKRIIEGVIKDMRAGGVSAILAKIKRIDRHRLSLLLGPLMQRLPKRNARK